MQVKKIGTFIYRLESYLTFQSATWFLIIVLIVRFGYRGSFLYLNEFHTPFLDPVALFFETLGQPVVIISLFALFFARRHPALVLCLVLSLAFSWYTLIAFQYNFFEFLSVPSVRFKGLHSIHVVGKEGDRLSFPAVHTLGVSFVFSALAFIYNKNQQRGYFLAILAFVFAYAPVYTGHHFPADILAASILSTVFVIYFLGIFYENFNKWFEKRNEWAKGLCIAVMRTFAIMMVLLHLKDFQFLIINS